MNEERRIEIEEVGEDGVPKPPKARVDSPARDGNGQGAPDAGPGQSSFERKRDYLAGFLAQKPVEPAPAPSGSEPPLQHAHEPGAGLDLREAVVEALKEIYDPEIPVNIYDLGLIYGVEVSPDADARIVMTLTTPHCPVAESMPAEVEMRVNSVPGIRDAEVELVWDPPWDPQKMSDEAKLELGML